MEMAPQVSLEDGEPSCSSRTVAASVAWVRGAKLGSGSYGHVSMALDSAGRLFAVKSVDASSDSHGAMQNLRALENEIELLSDLHSPYIVRYLGSSWTKDGIDGARLLNLHMELAAGGSLAGVLKATGPQGLGLPLVQKYTRDLVLALEFLHSRGVVHRDVKCLNVLVGATCAKLADFGSARKLRLEGAGQAEEADKRNGLKGSPYWMSPESAKELASEGTPADIWSLGCTVLEMATGKAPWSEVRGGGLYGVLHALGRTERVPHVPSSLPKQLRQFILSCLRRNPEDRPTAAELLVHPFLLDEALGARPAILEGAKDHLDVPETVPSPVSGAKSLWELPSNDGPDPTCQETPIQRKRSLSHLSVAVCNKATEGMPPSPLPIGSSASEACTPVALERPPPRKRRDSECSIDMVPERIDSSLAAAAAEESMHFGAIPVAEGSYAAFPILDLMKGSPWCTGDASSPAQSPLSASGSKWIVVHSSDDSSKA